MKELEKFIEENKRLYQRKITKRNELKNIMDEKELKNMQYQIIELYNYIKGLEQAKNIIENNLKEEK